MCGDVASLYRYRRIPNKVQSFYTAIIIIIRDQELNAIVKICKFHGWYLNIFIIYNYIYLLHIIIYGLNVTIRKYRYNYSVVITDFRKKKKSIQQ